MSHIIILPILIPLITAAVSLLGWKKRIYQKNMGVVGAFLLLVVAVYLLMHVYRNGIIAVQMGSWIAPFGITLVCDLFSAIMVLLAAIIAFATILYSCFTVDKDRESFGYYPLMHLMMMGICGAFLTGDIFNLYVWFEVLLISSFVLLVLGGEKQQMEGAIKYVTLNLLSSTFFLVAVGILYGLLGTLNMADLAIKIKTISEPGLITLVSVLFLMAFGIKAAIFPMFFWLPASYHTPPVAVSAVFAGLLTKVGVYALIRVFTLIFIQDTEVTHSLILGIAAFTMVTGVLGAAAQNEFRRILSFHIISQIGYMIMGLGLFTKAALAGSVFYIIHHIIVKSNLFLVSGFAHKVKGSFHLSKLGDMYRDHPYVSIVFLVSALSLAGLPPLSGFFAKFILIKSALEVGQYGIVVVALIVGLLTLFSMTKIWQEVFWKKMEGSKPVLSSVSGFALSGMFIPMVWLALMTVCIGFGAQFVFGLSLQTAEQLMDPTSYVAAVLQSQQ